MPDPSHAKPTDLVVFDFDGTLTTEDTFVGFMKYMMGGTAWYARMAGLIPTFLAYKLGRVDRHAVKHAVVKAVFTGRTRDSIESLAESYARDVIPTLIRPAGMERFREHHQTAQAGGPTLAICSASIRPYLKFFFRDFSDVPIVACELEYASDDICTGRLTSINVWGENKVRALQGRFGPEPIRILEAYGDTQGDVPMLELADTAHWRPFRDVREY